MGSPDENGHSDTRTTAGRTLSAVLRVIGFLPLRLARALGTVLGWLLFIVPNRNRRVAARNLELCFPELEGPERRRLLRRTLVETGRTAAELGFLWTREPEEVLARVREVRGGEALDRALASGRGVLIGTPHLGSWELLCLYIARRHPLLVLYREPRDPGVEAVVNAGRARTGAQPVRAGGAGVRRLYRALKEGRALGILPDHQPKRGKGEFAPFFGVPAQTMVLFPRLARRAEGGVFMAWAERLPRGGTYRLHFEPMPPEVADADPARAVVYLNREIEARVRRCPAQYQWTYKRFSRQPDGAPSPY